MIQVDYDGTTTNLSTIRIQGLNTGKTNWTLNLFPNPGNGKVQIASSGSNDLVSVAIYDSKGMIRMIESKDLIQGLSNTLSELNSGIYFVQFIDLDGLAKTVKYIKE